MFTIHLIHLKKKSQMLLKCIVKKYCFKETSPRCSQSRGSSNKHNALQDGISLNVKWSYRVVKRHLKREKNSSHNISTN